MYQSLYSVVYVEALFVYNQMQGGFLIIAMLSVVAHTICMTRGR